MRDFLWFIAGGFGMLGSLHLLPFVQASIAQGMERDVGYGVAVLVVSFVAGIIAHLRYGDDD